MLLGISAFALLFLSDYNDWKLSKRALKWCFPTGFVLLLITTVLSAGRGVPLLTGWARGLLFLFGALFLGLLAYTLFFAVPAAASYTRPGQQREVVTGGPYALCRHPGVLWFTGLYGCLWAATGLPFREALVYSGLNVLLVLFEDRCVFPKKLSGYDDYKRTTPFLLPNKRSIRNCVQRGEFHAL